MPIPELPPLSRMFGYVEGTRRLIGGYESACVRIFDGGQHTMKVREELIRELHHWPLQLGEERECRECDGHVKLPTRDDCEEEERKQGHRGRHPNPATINQSKGSADEASLPVHTK